MQAERDHLVRFVFPKLRQELLPRRFHLVDVDLRWGVTSEQDALEVCGEIIDECRPRFLCLLGGRYGWVPPGKSHSITAAEVYYAVLDRTGKDRGFAYFYFRDDAATAAMVESIPGEFHEPQGSENQKKLSELKQAVAAGGFNLVTYMARWDTTSSRLTDLKQFGDRVYADLLGSVDAEFGKGAAKAGDEFAEENAAIEAFVEERSERFVLGSREPLLNQLLAHAGSTDGNGYVCLTGAPGCGKSTLLAYLSQHPVLKDQSVTLLIRHFVGASPGSTDVRRTLRRLCREIKAGCPDITADIPNELQEIRTAFPTFLQQVCVKKRVVILLDAVDQFDSALHSSMLNWLPGQLPANARVIVSALEGPVLEEMRSRPGKMREIELQPLTASDGEAIIDQFLKRYRKRFEPDQRAALLAKTDARMPLYLLVALEELRTLGTYEEIMRRITELPPTTHALFIWILDRLENDDGFRDASGRRVGRELVRRFASLLGASRFGLSQRELADLLDSGDAQGNVAALLHLVRPYLMRRGELLDFYHGQFRAAATESGLRMGDQRQAAHQQLAEYFGAKMLSSRTITCVPWHLDQAHDWERLRDCLSNLSLGYFESLFSDPVGRYELLTYWQALATKYDIASTYKEALATYQQEVPPGWDMSDLAAAVGEFLQVAGEWDAAERMISEARRGGPVSQDTAQQVDVLRRSAVLQWKKGNLSEAENLLRQALALAEPLRRTDDLETAATLTCLGEVLREKGDLENAKKIQSQALAFFEKRLGVGHPNTITSLTHLGFVCFDMRDLDAAETHLRRALELDERIYGVDHAHTSNILNGLAVVSKARHDLSGAVALCQRALLARERAIGPTHPELFPLLFTLGRSLFELGDYGAAEPVLTRAIKIREHSVGLYDDTSAKLLRLLGMTLGHVRKYSDSMEVLGTLLSVHEKLLGRDHPETVLDRQLIDATAALIPGGHGAPS